MEKTSIVTHIAAAAAHSLPDMAFTHGIPDAATLQDLFEQVPLIQERAQLSETHEETDQGHLVRYRMQANVPRDEYYHRRFHLRHVLLYIELLDGERVFLGGEDSYVKLSYSRDSGATASDNNQNRLEFTYTCPYTP